jgi:hypothetical protein
MRKAILGLAVATMTLPALPAPALAYQSGYYDRNGNYVGPVWQGQDGRRYCRRSDGTTGLIVGAAGGALVGRAIDTRGSRGTGTILGAAVGALIGREIERGRSRCR